MKPWQFYITVALSAACLILSVVLMMLSQSTERLQGELQRQQEEINRGSMSQQIAQNMLRDLAQLSLKNTQIRDLLAKNGLTVNVNPAPAQSGTASTPAP